MIYINLFKDLVFKKLLIPNIHNISAIILPKLEKNPFRNFLLNSFLQSVFSLSNGHVNVRPRGSPRRGEVKIPKLTEVKIRK